MGDRLTQDDQAEPETEEQDAEQTETQTEPTAEDDAAEIEARYKKEIAGLNRKISELEKSKKETEQAGMTELEKRQAEIEETKSLILEERTQRIKAENRAAARDMLTEAGITRVPRILDELVKDDPEATRDAVGKYIEERKEERAEWAKEYARQNGRTVSGPREDSPDNKLPELTPEQMRRLPPDVRATYSA